MRMRNSLVASCLPLVALAGCARLTHDIGAPLPLEAMSAIPDRSHYSDVLQSFGPPTKVSALSAGMVFLYEHVDLDERQYGLILPGEVGNWIKAVYATADADVEIVQFVFDDDGRLVGSDEQVWSSDAGAGMSVTLIFSAGSFTDTEQYENAAATPLDWGRGLTEPPLTLLNAAQNLETGANGVQLTTNSGSVGQHTLELDD